MPKMSGKGEPTGKRDFLEMFRAFPFQPDSRSCRRCSHSSRPENQPSISIQLNKEGMEILWIKLKENRWRVDNYFKQTSPNWASWGNDLTISNLYLLSLSRLKLDMSERNWGGKAILWHCQSTFVILSTSLDLLVDLNKMIKIQVITASKNLAWLKKLN